MFLSNIDVFSTIIKEYIKEPTITQQQIIDDINFEINRVEKENLAVFDTILKGKLLKWIGDK